MGVNINSTKKKITTETSITAASYAIVRKTVLILNNQFSFKIGMFSSIYIRQPLNGCLSFLTFRESQGILMIELTSIFNGEEAIANCFFSLNLS